MATRRNFLKTAAAAPLLQANVLQTPQPALLQPAPGFRLLMMATNWGFPGTLDAFCQKAKSDGYDGIELWTPGQADERKTLSETAQQHGLALGVLCGSWQSDFQTHAKEFETALENALSLKPLYINCHSGRDWFLPEQNAQLLAITARRHRETGIPIYHETHRGRMLYAAHVTQQFIEKDPDLRLTLDISHWCAVHESFLHDQEKAVQAALERVGHIHARVGFSNGPQVNDPRAPEWESALQRHLGWWDAVLKRKAAAGATMTILTEFGPPDYLQALPYTRQPVADQWEINKYMKDLLKKRYA